MDFSWIQIKNPVQVTNLNPESKSKIFENIDLFENFENIKIFENIDLFGSAQLKI